MLRDSCQRGPLTYWEWPSLVTIMQPFYSVNSLHSSRVCSCNNWQNCWQLWAPVRSIWKPLQLRRIHLWPFQRLIEVFAYRNQLKFVDIKAESFYYVYYRLPIITSKVRQIISVMKIETLAFLEKWYLKNSSSWHLNSHFVLKTRETPVFMFSSLRLFD